MKSILCLLSLFFISSIGICQSDLKQIDFKDIKKLGTINFGEIEDPYEAILEVVEAPPVSGHSFKAFMAKQKEEMKTLYPRKQNVKVEKRSASDPPRVIKSWIASNGVVGRPLDTHLGVSDEGQVISSINQKISIYDMEGLLLKSFTLNAFSLGISLPSNKFDPRVYYDPQEEKFVLMFLAGSNRNETAIFLAFSETSDALGNWSFYQLPGNPDMTNVWTDFPMITMTPSSFIVTVNYILDGVSWELGFDETVIWKVDKLAGYKGEDIDASLLREVAYEGKNVRNMCPVKSGDGVFSETVYFMSNRNFDMENDTFFLGKLNEDNSFELEALISPVKYGAPPNALQVQGELQTNDARVLDAFIIDDEIHFVGNTRNIDNNMAGIYHGIISNLSSSKDLELTHIIGENYEIGYPGISYAGTPASSDGAMISFDHTAADRFAGISAMWYDFDLGYSDIITVHEGDNYIDMLSSFVDRWGDYTGSQRKYNDPETVWINGTYGSGNNMWGIPWAASLATPDGILPTENTPDQIKSKVFPNPLVDQAIISFDVPNDAEKVEIYLYDMQGKMIDVLYNSAPRKKGKSEFSFVTNSIPAGSYLVNVNINGDQVLSEKIIVLK